MGHFRDMQAVTDILFAFNSNQFRGLKLLREAEMDLQEEGFHQQLSNVTSTIFL